MSARWIAGLVVAGAALTGLVVACASCCGPSPLRRAYEKWLPPVEKLLDKETEVGTSLEKLLRSQYEDDKPDFDRYAEFVQKTAVPFYDQLVVDVKAVPHDDPGLDAVQAELERYAQHRNEFAHVLAAGLDAVRHSDSTISLAEKEQAADRTTKAYAATLTGPAPTPDPRFTQLKAYADDFQTGCLLPIARGEKTTKEVADHVRRDILPNVAKLRATKFEDDESSRRLRDAVAAAEEFYAAFLEDLPQMQARARLSRSIEGTTRPAVETRKKFQEALSEVRRKL